MVRNRLWARRVNAIHFLRKMANELGQTDDDAHWQSMHGRLYENWSRAWEGHAPRFLCQ